MASTFEVNRQIQERLAAAGLGFESLNVFGVIRCNVHVVCVGRETAQKWADLLAQSFKAKPTLVEHRWNAAENKNTSMRPTMRKGFLVAIAA